MSTRRSIERYRMKFAHDYISQKNFNRDSAKKFESYVQKVPALILTNGLGNTFAFLLTKKSDEQWSNVHSAIVDWLWEINNPIKSKSTQKPSFEDILKILKNEDFSNEEYRAVTVEVLALFNWLRRFAKARQLQF